MSGRNIFADMRRAGMGVGVSKTKLSDAMLAILLQLPTGSADLKETIIRNLGMLGQMAPTRDLDQAWNQTKKKAAKLYPDKFILGPRNILSWNDGTTKTLDKDISPANFKKLNDLADAAGCTVNALVSQLIKAYKQK
ncbi:MAG: hypothetical protein HY900_08775 [Deltaproteobacteria bacterium]|nr:hypothetical protein [Deltaproteobacteria bacterium]